ncbi:MAG: S-layer protein [Methanoregulaceae archaeon]
MAETKLMAGTPSITAAISGKNEFAPGDDVSLQVIIQNTGINDWKFVNSNISDSTDQPNMAKLMLVTLRAGDAPVTIKSKSQMIGSLPASNQSIIQFDTKISYDAPSGTYNLPLDMNYTYIWTGNQYSQNTIQYYYRIVNETIQLPIKIKPVMRIAVLSSVPEHVNSGTEGYLHVQVQNIGHESGKKTILRIAQSGTSPVTPTESSEYIGDFPPNATINATFKVTVTKDAQAQTYPLDVYATYENSEGDTVDSDSVTIGVPVGKKIEFAVISPAETLAPGETKTISVVFQNTGSTTVYSAKARLSMTAPFTSTDDIAYLGDLGPGEKATANFIISVDKEGTLKDYGLDSEVQYRDALNNDLVSDTIKVDIGVASRTGIAAITGSPIALTIIAGVIIGIIYAVFRFAKRKQ